MTADEDRLVIELTKARIALLRDLDAAASDFIQRGGRPGLAAAYRAVYDFIKVVAPEANFHALSYLGSALSDLDQGVQRDELKPSNGLTHRPGHTFERQLAIGITAAAVEILMQEGEMERAANTVVARALTPYWPGGATPVKVDNWRSRVRAEVPQHGGTIAPESAHYVQGYIQCLAAWHHWKHAPMEPPYSAKEFLEEYCVTFWRDKLAHLRAGQSRTKPAKKLASRSKVSKPRLLTNRRD